MKLTLTEQEINFLIVAANRYTSDLLDLVESAKKHNNERTLSVLTDEIATLRRIVDKLTISERN